MSSIRAVFLDMDGTMLNEQAKLNPLTLQVLSILREKGVKIIIATGRATRSVLDTVDEFHLLPDYIITHNGAIVLDGASRNTLCEHLLPPECVQRMLSITRQPREDGSVDQSCPPKRFIINAEGKNQWYTDVYDEYSAMHFGGPSWRPKVVPMAAHPEQYCQDILAIWCLGGNAADIMCLEAHLRREFDAANVSVQLSMHEMVDVAPAGVNKGKATQEVCELMNIPLRDVAAFGDSMNDLEMLKVVGHPHVMGNGHENLKAALPGATVVGTNTEDGVAKRLMELFTIPVPCG